MATPDTPQLAYPFEFTSRGGFREVEQRSLDDIAACVEVILRYPEGFRPELPEFGLPDLLFRENRNEISSIIEDAILRWEPDASVLIEERPDIWDRLLMTYLVTVEGESA